MLARDRWGRGYAPEAARALLDHAFLTTPVERVFAPIFAENVKSRRAAEKMGLTLEGVLRSSPQLAGPPLGPVDLLDPAERPGAICARRAPE